MRPVVTRVPQGYVNLGVAIANQARLYTTSFTDNAFYRHYLWTVAFDENLVPWDIAEANLKSILGEVENAFRNSYPENLTSESARWAKVRNALDSFFERAIVTGLLPRKLDLTIPFPESQLALYPSYSSLKVLGLDRGVGRNLTSLRAEDDQEIPSPVEGVLVDFR